MTYHCPECDEPKNTNESVPTPEGVCEECLQRHYDSYQEDARARHTPGNLLAYALDEDEGKS